MPELNFDTAFTALTGNAPFPWQQALYARFAAGDIPDACTLPTGLGKTSVIAVWLIALANHPDKMPRRLVYVVNRRTVVDQTTDEAVKYRRTLADNGPPWHPVLLDMSDRLRALSTDPTAVPLAISTLRGQFADNREWSADPSRPAIICGTVDMIGSRLLFSGYGVGRYVRAHQVGLIGCDTLLVHDEAHLEPPFQKLIETIRDEQKHEPAPHGDRMRLKVMELTATSRGVAGGFPSDEEKERNEKHAIVQQRLDAAKTITLHTDKDVTAKIIKLAGAYKDSGRAILVFVQTPDQVNQVKDKLTGRDYKIDAKQIATLTGTMRGYDRDRLATACPVFARFLPEPKVTPAEGTVYLVCTSAGEVGVDISADDLICDLSTYESMAQRFGRVNRRGGTDPATDQPRHARIDIVHEPEIETDTPRGERRELTRRLMQRLVGEHRGSASPRTLGLLPEKDRADAFSPCVPTLEATDILLDAWALTTITDDLPGRPPVAQWLHGVEPPDQPTTSFAWRAEVALLAPKPDANPAAIRERATAIQKYLDEYPLKTHETLAERTARLVSVPNADPDETGRRQHLKQFAQRVPELPAWLIDRRGRVQLTTIGELAELEFAGLMGRTIVLPPDAGGLSSAGMLEGKEKYNAACEYDVADHSAAGAERSRFRSVRSTNEDGESSDKPVVGELPDKATRKDRGFQPVAEIGLDENESGETNSWFVGWVAADSLEGEQSRSKHARFEQTLCDHLKQAERYATALAERLLPDGPERLAVRLAAKWHDLGKDRDIWQIGVGNPRPRDGRDWKGPLAKSGKSGRITGLDGYRHEFGSLLDVAHRPDLAPEFPALPPEVQDLLLHLIAAHHGRGRPHFPVDPDCDPPLDETFEPAPKGRDVPGMAAAVPQRFARLQRKYGRWGLAYLESLVRAADILASQRAEGGVS